MEHDTLRLQFKSAFRCQFRSPSPPSLEDQCINLLLYSLIVNQVSAYDSVKLRDKKSLKVQIIDMPKTKSLKV